MDRSNIEIKLDRLASGSVQKSQGCERGSLKIKFQAASFLKYFDHGSITNESSRFSMVSSNEFKHE